ncbi:hypothetical protein GCM10027200_05070 [Lentzea nigeriaca]
MELGEIVAERRIGGVAPDGSHFEVVIRFGAPRPDPLRPQRRLGLSTSDRRSRRRRGRCRVRSGLAAGVAAQVYAVRVKLAESGGTLDWLGMPELGLTVAPVLS